jgi:hypothetical protein
MRNTTRRVVYCGLVLSIAFMLFGCATALHGRFVGGDAPQTSGPTEKVPVLRDEPPPQYPRGAPIGSELRKAYRKALDAWLAPPPPEQPQPKLACERPECDAEPVWYGQRATFSWEVTNTGAAPLRIHMVT